MLKNEIKYDLKKEKEKIDKCINKMPTKDKEEIEINERFSMRTIALCNTLQKLVSRIPRKVYFSNYLLKRMDENKNIINQINIFKKKFENGEDVNSNLSKGIFSSNSWDYALNIWNIRHLHLSKSVKFDRCEMSKNRSDYLLFFVLKGQDVYFIDVRNHPKGSGFTSFGFLEILDEDNWLNVIGFEEVKDIICLEQVIEKDEDFYCLTKAGVNTMYKINGKYYMNCMGITTLGNKAEHTFAMIEIRKKIDKFLEETQIEYVGFKLLLNGCFGIIKYKFNSEEKQLRL